MSLECGRARKWRRSSQRTHGGGIEEREEQTETTTMMNGTVENRQRVRRIIRPARVRITQKAASKELEAVHLHATDELLDVREFTPFGVHSLYSVALGIINTVTILDGCNIFQLNLHQCKRLVDAYNRAWTFFQELRRRKIDLDSHHLIPILKKGQLLVYKYTQACSFETMVTAGVNQASFVAIYVELEDCMRSIYAKIEGGVVKYFEFGADFHHPIDFDAVAPIYFLNQDDRATLFEGDAQKDKNHMIEMIQLGGHDALNVSNKLISESTKITTNNLARVMTRERNLLQVSLRAMEKVLRDRFQPPRAENIVKTMISTEKVINISSNQMFPIRPLEDLKDIGIALEQIEDPEESKLPEYLKIDSSEFEFLEKLGYGSSAEIYKCQWENYEYAVKIFKAGDVGSLRKEVQNLIELPRHPNIIDLVGFSILESDNRPMVIMELLDCDLFTLVRTGEYKVESKFQFKKFRVTALLSLRKHLTPFPIGVAIDFIYQVATGMSFLHRRKIFHGDLKALNVLVKRHRDGGIQLKISDFGFSEKLIIKPDQYYNISGYETDHSSFNSANAGTTRWMAPEVYGVADGDLEPYSMKADVYSFAMTCVEILTRDIPFPDLFTGAVREHVKSGGRPELPKTKDVPEDLRQLIVRCWDGNPLLRPNFSEICSCLQELAERFPL